MSRFEGHVPPECERCIEAMAGARLPLGRELVAVAAPWGRFMASRGASASTASWFVHFALWAFVRRTAEFVAYCGQVAGDDACDAIKGIERVQGFSHPNPTCAPVFFRLWGWLQKELGDPFWRKSDYAALIRQIESQAREEGTAVFKWIVTPFGGIHAVFYDSKVHGPNPVEDPGASRMFGWKDQSFVLKTMFDDPDVYLRLTGNCLPGPIT